MNARTVAAVLSLAAFLGGAPAASQPAAPVRFATVDVFIEAPEPLAAWQFELSEGTGLMTVVGVENGDSPAFGAAPYYDLATVERGGADRIIVADFSVQAAASLPTGNTRVATIHVRLDGAREPDYRLRLIAAGDASGRTIDAAITMNAETGR